MSTSSVRQRLTSVSTRQLLAATAGLCGAGGAGAYLYYRTMLLPALLEEQRRQRAMAPRRRTQQYISGTADGSGLLPESERFPHLRPAWLRRWTFAGYVGYRLLLLWWRGVPLLWWGLLTQLRLCARGVFYLKFKAFLADMGPSYIKLGQWIATRPDFFPAELCEALEGLFDSTAPHAWRHTEALLRRPYADATGGGPRNALYYLSEIEKRPINSGSIAQVHRARLREAVDGLPAGTELALKITHPHIREQIAADLCAMRLCLALCTRCLPTLRYFNVDKSINEFSSLLRSQLDLRMECDNLQQFRYNFRHVKGIVFPTPLPSLSTEDILFETFEAGEPLQRVPCTADNADIADLGCHMFLKMLFEDNFVHSDLHPGNLLLRTNDDVLAAHRLNRYARLYDRDGKERAPRELVILDAGLVTSLSKDERHNFITLFAAVACGDGELGADLMIDRLPTDQQQQASGPAAAAAAVTVDRDKFRDDMKLVFDMVSPKKTEGFKLSHVRLGTVLAQVLRVVRENHTSLDGNFASLVLTVIVGEGLGRKLVPDFNIFSEAAPYMITYLDNKEFLFLANKLRQTYGASELCRDSTEALLHRTDKANHVAEVATRKTMEKLQQLAVADNDDDDDDAERGERKVAG
ncbi:aarF domain-containing kinase [Strigomonas culicis]|uniref:AarF domain-containing kinase n=2 Tax=Strigomonas culicis TaxID=28005 RepID=S9V230_9TRYP|nr:ubiquinone biosynthesis protein [Strigomonas culicis]EPY36677.1 aarF domain-containing kinase [Strigomonas culicis]EPY37112.1 aarF domain-containing kinase [Strigomonas culicis]|eukprot:EPY36677.1 aarF domain-containing kinase [Strigomonas culicis]